MKNKEPRHENKPKLDVDKVKLVMKEEITRVFGKRKTTYNSRLLETVFILSSKALANAKDIFV